MTYLKSLLPIAVILLVLGALSLLSLPSGEQEREVEKLKGVSWNQEQYKDHFVALAEEKGPPFAFEVLKYAPVAFGVDTHRIGHEIGYVLYREEGVQGLAKCTDRYTAACAHAVVTQEYVNYGTDARARLTDICLKKPAESLAYWDCFHGIGHGIVAFVGYDFKRGIEECIAIDKDIMMRKPDDRTALLGCIDGTTMEMFQGRHDEVQWRAQWPSYLPESDLLMPCNASFLPDIARPTCYSYIRARMLREVGLTRKDEVLAPEKYAEAVAYCDLIPPEEVASRKSCYGGFGVYFAYLVNGSDDRKFPRMTEEQMRTIHDMCGYAPNAEAKSACTLTTAAMIFAEGKGSERVADFCGMTPDSALKDRCFRALVSSLSDGSVAGQDRGAICARVPEAYRGVCL